MKIKVKRLRENAVLPTYAHPDDAGIDLFASTKERKGSCISYGTGIAVEIPNGYVGLVFPRSSVYKTNLIMENCVGVIDPNYRGEISVLFYPIFYNLYPAGLKNLWKYFLKCLHFRRERCPNYNLSVICGDSYNVGERIGQLVIIKKNKIEWNEVEELSDTDRGEGGLGSTGK